jgi:hypothetical protein
MSNERYLILSYFCFAAVCLGLGVLVFYILRRPFGAIVDALPGSRSALLKRALLLSLTMASVLGFLGVSYTNKGCMSYEQVVKERSYLVDRNMEQLQNAAGWIVAAVFVWGVVMVIILSARKGKREA